MAESCNAGWLDWKMMPYLLCQPSWYRQIFLQQGSHPNMMMGMTSTSALTWSTLMPQYPTRSWYLPINIANSHLTERNFGLPSWMHITEYCSSWIQCLPQPKQTVQLVLIGVFKDKVVGDSETDAARLPSMTKMAKWVQWQQQQTSQPDVSNDTNALDIDLIDNVCQTYEVTLDTLYAQTASWHMEANKDKHQHWKPPKQSSLPVSDIHSMMADKTDVKINGTKYSVKKVNSTLQHLDVNIEGVTYSISMALATYHVSASGIPRNEDCLLTVELMAGLLDMIVVSLRWQCVMSMSKVLSLLEPQFLPTMRQVIWLCISMLKLVRVTPSIHHRRWNIMESTLMKNQSRSADSNDLPPMMATSSPINIWHGLPYIDMRPYTDQEWELPHVIITHEADWDPQVLDNELSTKQDWYDSLPLAWHHCSFPCPMSKATCDSI